MRLHSLTFIVAIFLACPVFGQTVEDLTTALVEKRSAVERLTEEVESAKRARREQQRAFTAQKAQLDAELQREGLRHSQLTDALARKRTLIESAKESDAALLPVFDSGAQVLRGYIEGSLPFRRVERLSEVESLERKLKDGLLTPRNALTRLWSLVEDEQQLTKESNLDRDIITVDGEDIMADILRLGSVGLFFRTGDGRVGSVARTSNGWTATYLDGQDDLEQVTHLFDAFKKQIRVGYFQIPNLLPPMEVAQ